MYARLAIPLLLGSSGLLFACSGGTTNPDEESCATAGACTLEIISGDLQDGQVASPLPQPLAVRVNHSFEALPPVAIEFRVISGEGLLMPSEVNTTATFEASAQATLGRVASAEHIFEARLKDAPDVSVQFTATARPGVASKIAAITGEAQTGQAGEPLAQKLQVQVTDEFDNPIPEHVVRWTATTGDGSIAADAEATDEMGLASAQATLGDVAGTDNNLFSALSPGLDGSPVRFVASAVPGPATFLEVAVGDRQAGTRGQPLPEALTVLVTDRVGNPVAGSTVAFSAEAGSIEPAMAFTDETGRAGAQATLGPAEGEQRFTATVEGLNGSPLTFIATAFPPICSADEWCWLSPIPQGNTMRAAWSVTDMDVWVVGDHGTVLRWNGAAWAGYDSGVTSDLNGVYGGDPSAVWAVGDEGILLTWDGNGWSSVPSATNLTLEAIWGSDPNNIWAVGAQGTIVHYDGMVWMAAQSPTQEPLRGIYGTAADDVWAVGDRGTTLHFDGVNWTVVTNMDDADLNAVWARTPTDVWAVGDQDAYVRWNGTEWLSFPGASSQALRGVWGAGPDEVFAVGDRGRLRRWDGSRWSTVGSGTANNLNGIVGTNRGPMAVGEGGVVIRKPQNDWVLETSRRLRPLQGVWGSEADLMWAVGLQGTILQWTGLAWTPVEDLPRADLFAVSGTGPTDAWAVGEAGVIMRWDGAGWSTSISPTSETLLAVHAIAPDDAWAVGEAGAMVHWDGSQWSVEPRQTELNLYGVWGTAGDLWVVGDVGTLLRFTGGTWTAITDATMNWLLGVRGTGPDDVWAFGVSGTILHWDGAAWTESMTSTVESIFAMYAPSPTSVWAVGDRGTVLRYTGAGWAPQISGTANVLFGVHGASEADVWAVGDTSTILRWNP